MAKRSVLEDHLDIVGHLSDREVADRLGMTAENIRAWRSRRNIPARWRGDSADAAAGDSKTSSAPKVRRSVIAGFEHLFGIVPDLTIAYLSGRKVGSVAAYRQGLGIQPAPPRDDGAKPPRYRKSKLGPHLHLLGKMADTDVAIAAGVTEGNVANFRRRHRIPSARRVTAMIAARSQEAEAASDEAAPVATEAVTPAEPAPEAPPSAAKVQRWAFMATIEADGEELEYAVLGADLAEAAASATRELMTTRPSAVLITMKRFAEVL